MADGSWAGPFPRAACPALARLVGAAAFQGPLVVPDSPAVAGPWCWDAPLWDNPALTGPDGMCLEAGFPELFGRRGLTTMPPFPMYLSKNPDHDNS